jgi:hypothetical protein
MAGHLDFTMVYVLLKKLLIKGRAPTLYENMYISIWSEFEDYKFDRNKYFKGISYPLDHSGFDEHIDLQMQISILEVLFDLTKLKFLKGMVHALKNMSLIY